MKRLLLLICCCILYLPLSGQHIRYAEYFIDQDPGLGKATSLSFTPGTHAEIHHTIPIHEIDNGFHLLYTRVKDADGKWSQTNQSAFFVKSLTGNTNSDIRDVEYFFNQDPGFGNAHPLSFTDGSRVTVTALLPLSGIPEGVNTLYVRTKDSFNSWSQTSHFTFLVQRLPAATLPDIQEIEYFIDEDPGPGNGNLLAFEISIDITLAAELPLDTFSEGIHTLYLRAKDSYGAWGMVSGFNFLVQQLPALSLARINRMEYFIDQDPGFGKGQAIHAEPDEDLLIATDIPLETMNDGVHTLYVRARDEQGRWGMVSHANFLKVDKLKEKNEIIALEYFINEDPGFGNGIPIRLNTPKETTMKYFVLEGTQLQTGKNTLYVRGRNINRTWGHVYTAEFEVLENGACSPPTNLVATEVTESEAKLGWSNGGEASTWDVLWVKNGQDYTEDGTLEVENTVNPLQANQLTPATLYNFYVRSWCPDGQVSGWADPGVFHTLPLAVNELTLYADPPSGGNCTGGGSYSWGEQISVTANPNQGFVFSYWSGDTSCLDHTSAPSVNLVMPEVPVTLTAHFLDISGIEEHHGKSLRIYPVPARDELWVAYDNPNNEKIIVQLINLHGKILSQYSMEGTGLHKIRIELSTMSPGLYLLKLDGAAINTTRKVVINH